MRYFITLFSFSHFSFLLFLVGLCSCSNFDNEKKNQWLGKKLDVPEINYVGKKIVVRFEGDCPSCIESIKYWEAFSKLAREKDSNVKLIFYVEVVKEEKFTDLEKKLNFADDVIFDQRSSFYRNNLLKFPHGIEYQTFLLDKDNRILLIGNPIMEKKLLKKYIKEI